jgi:hypothetical protein
MTEPVPQPPAKRRLRVEPEPGGQLEQFLIANKAAHDAKTKADEEEADVKTQIKSWLLSLFPNPKDLPDSFDIVADAHGRYPGYTMTLKGGTRLDSKRLREAEPGLYQTYEVKITPSWDLREASTGRRHR